MKYWICEGTNEDGDKIYFGTNRFIETYSKPEYALKFADKKSAESFANAVREQGYNDGNEIKFIYKESDDYKRGYREGKKRGASLGYAEGYEDGLKRGE